MEKRKKVPSTFLILTYGCQMNELDSDVLSGELKKRGLTAVSSEEEADLLIFNTCSVRDLAERKVLGKLGLLLRKKTYQNKIIGITGCMAMRKKEKLLESFPHLDFILGPDQVSSIHEALDHIENHQEQIAFIDPQKKNIDYLSADRKKKIKAYVSIIKGCDNFCSYCIVPYTRGREISRPFLDILEECTLLADKGYKEITLLGQNVNSYGKDFSKKIPFSELLYALDKIPGLERIRFLTSHPKDISLDLIYAMRDLPSICNHLHFPIQSGSNTILKKMNRKYTSEDYLEKVALLQKEIPNIAISSDIIVGFPSESEEDFEETYHLMLKVAFSTSFIFIYSPRKDTPAYRLIDDVPLEIKKQRHAKLFDLQNRLTLQEMEKQLDKTVDVLIEKKNRDQKMIQGKTSRDEKVIFQADESLIGTIQKVQLEEVKNETFLGKLFS
jgi:tRNA-2-methylthio-N6-dimethylallyladenosine synthase